MWWRKGVWNPARGFEVAEVSVATGGCCHYVCCQTKVAAALVCCFVIPLPRAAGSLLRPQTTRDQRADRCCVPLGYQ